jgi:hypothetical protein
MIQIHELTARIINTPNLGLLSVLSELGELDHKEREQVLQTARVAYDSYIEKDEPTAWDYGCYRD